MANRVLLICSIVVLALLGAACGGGEGGEAVAPTALPSPTVTGAPTTTVPAESEEASTGAERTAEPLDPCAYWDAAMQTLLEERSFAEQSVAVEVWLESVHVSDDSPAVGRPYLDFRLAAEALAGAGWDFTAVDDTVLLAWVEGMIGNTLYGVAQPQVPREQCDVAFPAPESAERFVDCILRLEPAFTYLIELERDPSVALSEAEADALSLQVIRRWLDVGASPLCVSQILWMVPTDEIEAYIATLSPGDIERVATAGDAMAGGIVLLDYAADTRPVEAEAAIP